MERVADEIAALLSDRGITRCDVVGYSMGGRLALHLAVRFPARVGRLVLVGASPGLSSVEEREQRARADLELARLLEEKGIEWFVEHWESLPLLATQATLPEARRRQLRAQRMAQDPHALAACLRAFGTGFQRSLHPDLPGLAVPVLLVVGEQDLRYREIARTMQSVLPDAQLAIVPGAGHAVHLEQPERFVQLLKAFLAQD